MEPGAACDDRDRCPSFTVGHATESTCHDRGENVGMPAMMTAATTDDDVQPTTPDNVGRSELDLRVNYWFAGVNQRSS